jgi:prephenate dehydrogenase
VSAVLNTPVLVIGAGLIGTSIALACARAGHEVLLQDTRRSHLRTAAGLGAGRAVAEGDHAGLVVVAVPPRALAASIVSALTTFPDAVVTDVGSVKSRPLRDVAAEVDAAALRRYVGSHPMAGSERSGPLAASPALFEGRPWAITPHETTDPAAVELVTQLATLCGATVVTMAPEEHDRAVARTSHLPHLMSALVAGRLADAPAEHLALSGQGLRDVTRIAGSDPGLWEQIVGLNAEALAGLLGELRGDLDRLIAAVAPSADAGGEPLLELLDQGVRGTEAIPGKHGGPAAPTASVFVSLPDHPGELARLFADAGAIGVNIEDVHIDHDPGRPVGAVELVVAEESADHLATALESRDWVIHR